MEKLKINLINPPHPDASTDRMDAPLGLLYIAKSLERAGHCVQITDLAGGVPWDIEYADIYGISVYAPTIEMSRLIALKCRLKNHKCRIVVGGAHPTMLPESVDFADSIVIGEGEVAMLDLVKDYPDIKKRYRHVLDRDLDLYPNPAYHLVDLFSYDRVIDEQPCVTMLTSRGCAYHCAFCGLPSHCKTMKYRSAASVLSDIWRLKIVYGIKKFYFQDDSFTTNKGHMHRILDLIRPLEIGFKCLSRVGNTLDDYKKLESAGCNLICFGVESGSQKMLDRMNKQTTVEQNHVAIKLAKEAGLRTKAFFVFGFPGETRETIEETKRFIEKSKPDEYCISNFVPFPGTDVWNSPAKYGITWMSKDFGQYYQVNRTENGGLTISTDVLSVPEFRELELEFRSHIKELYHGEVFFNGRVLQVANR